MSGALRRRLERLARRRDPGVGRCIVVAVRDGLEGDAALLAATLAGAGVDRTDRDLVVLVRRYDAAAPPCALLSVTPAARRRGRP